MSLITDLLNTLTGGALAGLESFVGAGFAKASDEVFGGLTQAEQQQNAFNAAEADKARAWQEEFYNKYQSPGAQIAQYRDAGINPAVMFGQGPSSSSPASSPAASGAGGAGFAQLLNWMVGIKNAMSQSKLAVANANKAEAETENIKTEGDTLADRLTAVLENTKADTDLKRAQELVSAAQESKIFTEIDALGISMELDKMSISQKEAETMLTQAQTLGQDIQNYIDYMSAEEKIKYQKIYNQLVSAKTSKEVAEAEKILVEKSAELYELQYMEHFNTKIGTAHKYFGLAQSLEALAGDTFVPAALDLKSQLLSLWTKVKDSSVPYRKDMGTD